MCDSQRCTGTAATRTRLADASFKDTQTDGLSIQHLHEADIDSSREARVAFDQRSEAFYLGSVDIIDSQQHMRITDTGNPDPEGLTSHIKVMEQRLRIGQKRDTGRLENRYPHLDHDLPIIL